MKFIRLAQGMNATVDYHDLARVVEAGDWSFLDGMVALSRSLDKEPVYLHKFIMGADCTHVDGNGLNNCRANLQLVPPKKARKSRRKTIAQAE
jgi:hypothetical protein